MRYKKTERIGSIISLSKVKAAVTIDFIRIFRETGKPEREVITLDYDSVLSGQQKDIEIKDKDIIIVETSAIRRFFSKLTAGIGAGMFRVGGAGF